MLQFHLKKKCLHYVGVAAIIRFEIAKAEARSLQFQKA
nr:MAG TPA: hypothetical protein [Caudoviricetes sp.]